GEADDLPEPVRIEYCPSTRIGHRLSNPAARPLLSLRLTIIGRLVQHSRASESQTVCASLPHTFQFASVPQDYVQHLNYSIRELLNSGERAERNYTSAACL